MSSLPQVLVLSYTIKSSMFWSNSCLAIIFGKYEVIILLLNADFLFCMSFTTFDHASFVFQSSKSGRNSLSVSSSRMADTGFDLWNLIHKKINKENIIDANKHGFRKINHVKVT